MRGVNTFGRFGDIIPSVLIDFGGAVRRLPWKKQFV